MQYPALARASKIPWARSISNQISCSRLLSSSVAPTQVKDYFVTTPIFYPNADPHIGHLHSMVIADVFRRYQALRNNRPMGLYLTGTDEHGLKIQRVAEAQQIEPIELCDKVSKNFQALVNDAGINGHRFIRTTEKNHKIAVQHLWRKLVKNGQIYKGSYQGWYSVSDEAYYTESQVEEAIDELSGEKLKVSKETGQRVEWVEEENYKFRLSNFQDRLIKWLQNNSRAVQPSSKHAELLSSLQQTPLADLSISRPASRLKWGIAVPDDEDHTIYVWIDALTNYLTATGYPWTKEPNKHWPADVQVIGKDILRFHAIYWPAMLMACDLPLPTTILTHAHWTMGKLKMSKSRGNVADPNELLRLIGVDGVRWYLIRNGGNFANDSDYSLERVVETYNVELIGQLGNLLQRIRNDKMLAKLSDKKLMFQKPEEIKSEDQAMHQSLSDLPALYRKHMDDFQPGKALQAVMETLSEANKYIANMQPWSPATSIRNIHSSLFYSAETLRIVAHCVAPVMPETAKTIRYMLGMQMPTGGEDLSIGGGQGNGRILPPTKKGSQYASLFPSLWDDQRQSNSRTETRKARPAIRSAIIDPADYKST